MFHNNAKCDIYIGTGAGKKLMEEMREAQKSIKIVSPFISPDLVDGLKHLHQQNVLVELITTESDKGNAKLLRTLVQQEVHLDEKAKSQRSLMKWILWGCYALMMVGFIVAWRFFVQNELRFLLYAFLTIIAFGLIILLLHYLIRNKQIYSYSYHPIFPFRIIKAYNSFGKRGSYLHSKIYIIDDRIVYLGSLNFTRNGTQSNYETRIRLTDSPSVLKIVEEFHYLMDEAEFPEFDLQHWGKQLFYEVPN